MLNWQYFHFSSGKRSVKKKEIAELILYLLYFISFVDLNKKKGTGQMALTECS